MTMLRAMNVGDFELVKALNEVVSCYPFPVSSTLLPVDLWKDLSGYEQVGKLLEKRQVRPKYYLHPLLQKCKKLSDLFEKDLSEEDLCTLIQSKFPKYDKRTLRSSDYNRPDIHQMIWPFKKVIAVHEGITYVRPSMCFGWTYFKLMFEMWHTEPPQPPQPPPDPPQPPPEPPQPPPEPYEPPTTEPVFVDSEEEEEVESIYSDVEEPPQWNPTEPTKKREREFVNFDVLKQRPKKARLPFPMERVLDLGRQWMHLDTLDSDNHDQLFDVFWDGYAEEDNPSDLDIVKRALLHLHPDKVRDRDEDEQNICAFITCYLNDFRATLT